MSYHGLEARFVPIVAWPGQRTKFRKPGPFRATVADTATLLKRELRHLGAKNILIQMEGDESQIRRDGYPRSDARFGPGVIITFDSRHGPLSYPCDTFRYWDQNLRAIALALEALRKVDRYGVTKRGEQYSGWKQIPSVMTPMAAAEMYVNMGGGIAQLVLRDSEYAREVYRRAVKAVHPDNGGQTSDFQLLQTARAVLERHHGAKA